MTLQVIDSLLAKGEGLEIEFKESYFSLSKTAFETICAFLNRQGGHLFFGVTNKGIVEGILESEADKMVNELVNNANNLNKLNPQFYLSPEIVDYNGKKIIYVYVPESSQVHRTAGKVFDRNATDGDIDITNNSTLVTQLYIRKQQTYTENRIFPAVQLSDLRVDLLQKVRRMANNQKANHPWMSMSDEELLRSAGLYVKDFQNGNEGYSLASVLLLGKDKVIQSILPTYKTDAIVRVDNLDRYDDRDDIRTNLLEAYERLMAFIAKHLPDRFYQEGTQRISLRDRIFREVIANLLVHREFTNAYPAKMIIKADKVITENWSKPHGNGTIDPNLFSPFPKNPVIAKFFKEIGWVEELGSGVRNTYKYGKIYSDGKDPIFEEGDVFKCIIPLDEKNSVLNSNQGSNQDSNQDRPPIKFIVSDKGLLEHLQAIWESKLFEPPYTEEQLKKVKPFLEYKSDYWLPVLQFCTTPKSRKEIFEHIGLSNQTKNLKNILLPLVEHGFVQRTIPDRITSSYQKYLTTALGKKMLQLLTEIEQNNKQ